MVRHAPTLVRRRSRAISSARGRPGGSSARPARRAGGAARRATGRAVSSRKTSTASPGYDVPAALLDLAVELARRPSRRTRRRSAARPGCRRPARPGCRGRPGRAARRPRGSRPARPRRRAAARPPSAPVGADRPALEEHLRLGDDLAPGLEHLGDRHAGRAVEHHAEGAARRRRRASARRCRRSSGRAAAGVATSSIPARTSGVRSTMTPSCPRPADDPGPGTGGREGAGSGAAVGQAAECSQGRLQPTEQGRTLGVAARLGAALERGVRRPGGPGLVLDPGADGGGARRRARWPGRPSRPAARAPWRRTSRIDLGDRVVGRARRGARSRIARTPGSSSAVACQAATTAAREVHRLAQQLALDPAGEAGVPPQLEGAEQVELVGERRGDAVDVQREDAVAAGSAAAMTSRRISPRRWKDVQVMGCSFLWCRPGCGPGLTYREYVPRVRQPYRRYANRSRGDPGHPRPR